MELPTPCHSFDVSYEEARTIQNELAGRVSLRGEPGNVSSARYVCGVDTAFPAPAGPDGERSSRAAGRNAWKHGRTAIAAAVIYDRETDEIIETVVESAPVYIPYVPGYLSFREGPAVLAALGALSRTPDIIVYDGCGIMHPRRLGIASHMSVLTGIPGAGCAKSRLCGEHDEPGVRKGCWTPVELDGDTVGCCLRTRDNVKPVYVSPGSGMSLDAARELVLSLAVKYRLPEPVRAAHNAVTLARKTYRGT